MLWPDRHIHTQNNPLSMLTQAMHLVARRSPVICPTVRASIRGRNSQTTNRIDIRMPHTPSQQDIQAHHLHLVREEVLIMERLVSLLCHRTRLVSSSRTPNKHLSTGSNLASSSQELSRQTTSQAKTTGSRVSGRVRKPSNRATLAQPTRQEAEVNTPQARQARRVDKEEEILQRKKIAENHIYEIVKVRLIRAYN